MNYEKNTIERMLEKINSKSTATYKCLIKKYFHIVEKNPDKYIPEGFEFLENGDRKKYMLEYYADLDTFAKKIKGIPSTSVYAHLTTVKKYFLVFSVDIPKQKWKDWQTMAGVTKLRPVTIKKRPTPDELKFMCSDARLKTKALVSFASATGMRIEEIVTLKLSDFDWENRSVIFIGKGDFKRIAFYHEECAKILENWKLQREEYIKQKNIKSKYSREGKQIKDDDRLFPFDEKTGRRMWITLLERAGKPFNNKQKVNGRNRYNYNFHCLRRYWWYQFEGTKINPPHLNTIGGHKSDLDNTYTEITEHKEKLAKEYKKTYDEFSGCLNVFSDYQRAKSEIGDKFQYQNRMIQKLNDENAYLKNEIDELKERVSNEITVKDIAVEKAVDTEKGSDKVIGELQAQIKELAKQFKILEKQYRK